MTRVTIICIIFLIKTFAAERQAQNRLLEHSFKNNSKEELLQFFAQWNKESRPVSDSDLAKSDDTIRQTYKVFTAFYKPQSIDSLGGSEWGNRMYRDVKFLIVQNSIEIYSTEKIYYTEEELDSLIVTQINKSSLSDSLKHKYLKRCNGKFAPIVRDNFSDLRSDIENRRIIYSMQDFRPIVKCKGKEALYLTRNYDDMLNAFLGNTHLPLGAGSIMSPARSTGESEKRKLFLENYIKIWYGHWGGYWQLYSYPMVYAITFDKNMKYAKVNFRMVYEGGEAILRNDPGGWKLISAQRTWIE